MFGTMLMSTVLLPSSRSDAQGSFTREAVQVLKNADPPEQSIWGAHTKLEWEAGTPNAKDACANSKLSPIATPPGASCQEDIDNPRSEFHACC